MDNSANAKARKFESFSITGIENLKDKMLSWANQFNICCFLDNHNYQLPYQTYDCLVGVGAIDTFDVQPHLFTSLSNFYSNTNDWIFGHFSYDLKNKIEKLTSHNFDGVHFPDVFLFVPEVVLQLKKNQLLIGVVQGNPKAVFAQILQQEVLVKPSSSISVEARIEKSKYIETVNAIRDHIKKGDCYEVTFCQEFFAKDAIVAPLELYKKLVEVSPNPFSAFYKIEGKHLLCASPERYLKKEGSSIISQPIKGTINRVLENQNADKQRKERLQESAKEKAENVMIVDLVRNDLSKICNEGSVKVKELFGIYSFPQVHQMISTIEGKLHESKDLSDIIKATFPMGSMTGAPKNKAMELIEKYESTKRGIFSGSVGYITPEKDFDFNVVIRSLMYNSTNKYLSYQVGSAITYQSIAEQEYEECLLKAAAIKKVLQ